VRSFQGVWEQCSRAARSFCRLIWVRRGGVRVFSDQSKRRLTLQQIVICQPAGISQQAGGDIFEVSALSFQPES